MSETYKHKWVVRKMELEDKFMFGQYKYYTLLEVMKDNPSYIDWLIEKNAIELLERANTLYETGEYIPLPNKKVPKRKANRKF